MAQLEAAAPTPGALNDTPLSQFISYTPPASSSAAPATLTSSPTTTDSSNGAGSASDPTNNLMAVSAAKSLWNFGVSTLHPLYDDIRGSIDSVHQVVNQPIINSLQKRNQDLDNQLTSSKKAGTLNNITKSRIESEQKSNQDKINSLMGPANKLLDNPQVQAVGKASTAQDVEKVGGAMATGALLMTPGLEEFAAAGDGTPLIAKMLLGKNALGGTLGLTANLLDQISNGRGVNWGDAAVSFANAYLFTGLMGKVAGIADPTVRVASAVAGQSGIGASTAAAQAAINKQNIGQAAEQGAKQGAIMGIDFEALGMATEFGKTLIKNMNPAYREQVRINQTLKPGFDESVRTGVTDPNVKDAIDENLKKNVRPVSASTHDAMFRLDPEDVLKNPDKYSTQELADQAAAEYVYAQMPDKVKNVIFQEISDNSKSDSPMTNIEGLSKKEAIVNAITQVTGDTEDTIRDRVKQTPRNALTNTSHFTDSVLGFISPAAKILETAVPKGEDSVNADITRFKSEIAMQHNQAKVDQYQTEIKSTDPYTQWKEWAVKRVQSEVEARVANAKMAKSIQDYKAADAAQNGAKDTVEKTPTNTIDADSAATVAGMTPRTTIGSGENNVTGAPDDLPQVVAEVAQKPADIAGDVTQQVYGDMTEKQIKMFNDAKSKDIILKREGALERKQAQLEKAGQSRERYFKALPTEDQIEFQRQFNDKDFTKGPTRAEGETDAQYGKRTNDWNKLKEFYHTKGNALTKAIQSVFPGFKGIDYYFPRDTVEDKGDTGSKLFKGRNDTLVSDKGFLKKRTTSGFDEFLQAIDQKGLKLKSSNPEVLWQGHEMDVAKLIIDKQAKDEIKNNGAKFVRTAEEAKPYKDAGWFEPADKSFQAVHKTAIQVEEAVDKQMYDKLNQLADDIGIKHERLAKIRGKHVGLSFRGQSHIQTEMGSGTGTLAHEIGHQLDDKYALGNVLMRGNSINDDELTELAKDRYKTAKDYVTPSYKKYVADPREKVAAFVDAYVNAPELAKEVAPNTVKTFEAFLDKHPELQQIKDIKPSIELQVNKQTITTGGLENTGRWLLPPGSQIVNRFFPGESVDKGVSPVDNVKDALKISNQMINTTKFAFSSFHLPVAAVAQVAGHIQIAVDDMVGGLNYMKNGDTESAFKSFADIPKQAVKAIIAPIADPLRAMYEGGDNSLVNQYRGEDPIDNKYLKDLVTAGIGRSPSEGILKGYLDELHEGIMDKKPIQAASAGAHLLMSTGYFAGDGYAKLGMMQSAVDILEAKYRNDPLMSTNEDYRKQVTQQVLTETQQRFMQMKADKQFWNSQLNANAQIAFLSTRMFAREYSMYVGTVQDLWRDTPESFSEGKIVVSPRVASTIATVATYTALTAVMGYMSGNKPQGLVDYIYYKDNQGVRRSIPGNPLTVGLSIHHSPRNAITSRLTGAVNLINQYANNENLYGQTINPYYASSSPGAEWGIYEGGAPFWPQIKNILENGLGVAAEPIPFQGNQEEPDQSFIDRVQQSTGFNIAPYWIQNIQ
jgi:hypothetical protein